MSALPERSFGAWLRTQREARGISLREIADASKISVRYLEALEQDRFGILPAPVFVRGFLREYARVVGLDPDEVVNLFLLASGGESKEEEEEQERLAQRRASGPSPLVYVALLAVAVLILLGLAALVWYWAARRSPATEPPPSELASRPVVEAPAQELPPAVTPAPSATFGEDRAATAAGVVDSGAAAPEVARPPATASAVPAAPVAAIPPAAAVPDGPLRVQPDFVEDCWVELVVDGGRRTSELRTSGEVLTLEAADSVLLTLGNPAGVRVELDGRPFDLPGDRDRVVRDLRIDRGTLAGRRPPDSTR
ncbi:MAG TPA: RodZ domain-containing protein [Thermoanaerobaculia bacterium]|nr:RodZ domain-containing protein [Thermoanaerobaculia bacterium]